MLVRRFIAIASCAGLLSLASTAQAALQVTFGANGSFFTVVDGDLTWDADGIVNNEIDVNSLTVGSYTFSSHLTTTNSGGAPSLAFVESGTNSIVFSGASGTGATTISIYANSTNFTDPLSPPTLNALTAGTFRKDPTGSNVVSTVSVMSYVDTANLASTVAAGTLVGTDSDGPLNSGKPSIALMDSTGIDLLTSPYALNLMLLATATGDGAGFDADGSVLLAPVPEPATIAVWSALGVIGVLAYRRRQLA